MSNNLPDENKNDSHPENHNIPLAGEIIPENVNNSQNTVNSDNSESPEQVSQPSTEQYTVVQMPSPADQSKKTKLPPTPEEIKKREEMKRKQKEAINKIIKILLIPLFCFICFIVLMAIFSITNIDTQFIKITLYGRITDKATNKPVSNASVIINSKEVAKSDDQGNYSASGLDQGITNVTVKADGYSDQSKDVNITRILVDYTTQQDFQLVSSKIAQLSGKLIPNIDKYTFLKDTLTINDQNILINPDGTFSASNIAVGNAHFKFKSVNFKDLDQIIPVKEGTNQIQPIQLIPAGDVLGILKSWVREDLILNTQFYVENVLQNQVDINQDGSFALKDLDVGKLYKIRVVAPGYLTRDYVLKINQGGNELFNFKLVENTTAVFLGAGTQQQSANQFYKSDMDGLDIQPITQFYRAKTFQEYYNKSENKLYYLTDQDQQSTDFIGLIRLPYSLDLNTNKATLLSTNSSDLGLLDANFIAKKMVSIKPYRDVSQEATKLQLMDLSGDNRITIRDGDGYSFSNIRISDIAKAVVYTQGGNNPGLYLYTVDNSQNTLISSADNILVFDISEDGKKILFQRKNDTTGLNDLVLFDSDANSTRVLKENLDGQQYRFIKGDNNKIIYFTHREDRDNIFLITIDQNKDDRVTGLTPDYQISAVYQQSGYVYYLTNKGLFVLDLSSPKNFKLVSDKATAYTGYNY